MYIDNQRPAFDWLTELILRKFQMAICNGSSDLLLVWF